MRQKTRCCLQLPGRRSRCIFEQIPDPTAPLRGVFISTAPQAGAFLRPYTMRIIFALLLAIAGGTCSAQNSYVGSLNGTPELDFAYLPSFAKPLTAVHGHAVKLQARVVWNGDTAAPINVDQHFVLAYTQSGAQNSPQNNVGELLWTHGVGAILGPFGLAIELWHRHDATGDGFEDDASDAIVWTQHNDRCAQSVLGSIPPGTMCLSPAPGTLGYITPANFVLKTGVAYWLRIVISPTGGGWASLHADLIDESAPATPVQRAMISFQLAAFFPLNKDVNAVVGRLAAKSHQPNIQFAAFDYGF